VGSRLQTPGRVATTIPRDVSERAFALATAGDCQGMLELLKLHPELWRLRDVEFRQPMHIAAQGGHLPMLQVLTEVRGECPGQERRECLPADRLVRPRRPERAHTCTTARAGSRCTLRAPMATPAWPSGSFGLARPLTRCRLRAGSRSTAPSTPATPR
jgi:hypothetical protein